MIHEINKNNNVNMIDKNDIEYQTPFRDGECFAALYYHSRPDHLMVLKLFKQYLL